MPASATASDSVESGSRRGDPSYRTSGSNAFTVKRSASPRTSPPRSASSRSRIRSPVDDSSASTRDRIRISSSGPSIRSGVKATSPFNESRSSTDSNRPPGRASRAATIVRASTMLTRPVSARPSASTSLRSIRPASATSRAPPGPTGSGIATPIRAFSPVSSSRSSMRAGSSGVSPRSMAGRDRASSVATARIALRARSLDCSRSSAAPRLATSARTRWITPSATSITPMPISSTAASATPR